jgi:type IV pilus assembly protein PilW
MTMLGRNSRRLAGPDKVRGLTLVELMIAMLLGMVVVASASAIFISNRQTYRATENIGRVQENSRMSFEMMARDIRQAAGNPCNSARMPIANVLNNAGTVWWSDWAGGIVGYDGGVAMPGLAFGTSVGQRIAGTDAIELKSGGSSSNTPVTVVSHNAPSAQFQVNTLNHGLQDFDIVMVCDFEQAAILQVTGAQPGTNTTIVHNQGVGTPGNCSQRLGFPANCAPNGPRKVFAENSMVVKLHAARWYIGRNPIGGNSLYRSILVNNGAGPAIVNQEIVQGVNNMTLEYLSTSSIGPGGAYVDASAVPANTWNTIGSVRVVLNLVSDDRIGTDGNQIQRNLTQTITLRNRVFL